MPTRPAGPASCPWNSTADGHDRPDADRTTSAPGSHPACAFRYGHHSGPPFGGNGQRAGAHARSKEWGNTLRIKVDAEKCEGHSRCYSLAPELVDVDDLGNASELNDGEVPAGLEDKARLIVDNCPEFAITIEE